MDEILLDLLNALEAIGEKHPELYDTECREDMGDPIFAGFISADPASSGYEVPSNVGLFSDEGNLAAKTAIQTFIDKAVPLAQQLGLDTFHKRLAAFQNPEIATPNGRPYDDFFGYTDPADYDESGN